MGDRSLRGRGKVLGGRGGRGKVLYDSPTGKSRQQTPGVEPKVKRRIKTFEEEVNAGPTEGLGLWASGGGEKKPHSTKSGRLSAARNLLNRAWGQKYTNKKNGTPV